MRRQRERVLEDWKNEQDRSPCQQIAVSMGGLPTVSFLFCLQTTPLPNSPPLLPSKKKKWRATGFLRAGALCCGCEEKKLVSVIQSVISVKPYPPALWLMKRRRRGLCGGGFVSRYHEGFWKKLFSANVVWCESLRRKEDVPPKNSFFEPSCKLKRFYLCDA